MTIGERIKTLRKELGLTQTEFGAKIGLKQTAVGMYELGQRGISEQSIQLIAQVFHVRAEWLRTGELPKDAPTISTVLSDPTLSETDKGILQLYIEMTPAQRQFIKSMIMETAALFSSHSTETPSPAPADAPAIPDEGEKGHSNDLTAAELADIDSEVERIRAALIDEKKQASALSSFSASKNA